MAENGARLNGTSPKPESETAALALRPADPVSLRNLGQAMGKQLKQTIIIENVGGAGGNIGVTRVENFCAGGSESIRAAVYAVAAGACDDAFAFDTRACASPLPRADIQRSGEVASLAWRGDSPVSNTGTRNPST